MTEKIGWNLNNSYARLPESFFSRLPPTPVSSPGLVIRNHSLAQTLGLDPRVLGSRDGVAVLAGNRLPEGSEPLAQAYAGHQFGHFTMLGDGRAHLLGEHITPQGERFDIQLKGSGKTPYSRGGDGRAALGPMLREYMVSEAMYGLGIPTTRSLAVVTTGEPVYREKVLAGAVLTRVAASHLRVGSFQYAAAWGTGEEVKKLADYTLERHFPGLEEAANPYIFLLQEVMERQAALIARWQLAGFIHGVMNTDNMALSGETIDYGPCAFMDTYDPATVFSSIDTHGRYAYGNQPKIAHWNLTRFAETLLPLLHTQEEQAVQLAQEAISAFPEMFQRHWLAGMRAKLGLGREEAGDAGLIHNLLSLMQKYGADFTNTFRALTLGQPEGTALFRSSEFAVWHREWQARLVRQPEGETSSHQLMQCRNPALIPRNHRVEEALEAAVERGDYSVMERFLKVLANPYAYSPEQADYAELPEPAAPPYRTFCGT